MHSILKNHLLAQRRMKCELRMTKKKHSSELIKHQLTHKPVACVRIQRAASEGVPTETHPLV